MQMVVTKEQMTKHMMMGLVKPKRKESMNNTQTVSKPLPCMALLVKTLSMIQLKAPVSLQILMIGIQNTKPKNGRLAKPATSI